MRQLVSLLAVGFLMSVLSGCGIFRIDPMHVLIRSDVITSLEQEKEIVSRAKTGWSEDGAVRVVYLQGTPYERGYQHGVLLRREVRDNLMTMYDRALGVFRSEEFFAEAYERLRPFIPQDYIDEMHGLAHGAKIPLKVVHYIHALPAMTEWGGKKRVKSIVKQMMRGELGTSCSNIGAAPGSTRDNKIYAVRVLDWGLHRISKLHEYPLIAVHKPNTGYAFANIGWVGFLGAISGMNEQGITLGEMGYGSPPNETLRGKPMPFLLRDVLQGAKSLADVRQILGDSVGTNSFVFLMTDGKSGEAEMYVKDRDRFEVFHPGEEVTDGDVTLPAIDKISYGGHYEDKMAEVLEQNSGTLDPELFMRSIIPDIAMKSNFQNVVYSPSDLRFWVNNAKSKELRAAEQPYTLFDLKKALAEFPLASSTGTQVQ